MKLDLRRRSVQRSTAVAVLALAGVVLAACSSNASNHTTTTTTSQPTTTTTTSQPTTTTTTSQPTTTTSTTTAGTTTCSVSQLKVTTGPSNGAAGTIYNAMILTNTSATTCTLQGYPGMQLLNAQGQKLPTNVVRGGLSFQDPAANQSPSLVTLASQQAAQYDWSYSDVPVGNQQTCPMASSVLVTPPNDFTSATISLQVPSCGSGTLHVSPVFPAG